MQEKLVELIKRMTVREDVKNSEDSISWHAHREAEKLVDEAMAEELREFLNQKPKKEQRQAAYFIIGKIGKNRQSAECAVCLIKHASIETDKHALNSLLTLMGDLPKPQHLDIGPIFTLLKDKRWLVRHAAINSLKHCQNSEAEDALLAILETTTDPYDIICCHSTLNNIGTLKALPALTLNLKSRKQDVKSSAELAIKAITSRL